MLNVSLLALLVSVGIAAAPKKPPRKGPKEAPPAAQVEPAPVAEPKSDAPVATPEPAPEPKPEPPKPQPSTPEPAHEATAAVGPAPLSVVETTKPKLVVLEVKAGGGIDPTIAAALADAITLEIQKRGFFTPTSMRELQTALGVERQRQLLGCSETASSCMTELADAIGARFVLSGSLTRLGDAYQLSLQTLDTTKAQPIGRSVRIVKDPSALNEQLPYAVAEATATMLPPPKSRVLPYTLIIGGAVLLLGAGVVGLDGTSRDRAVQAELVAGVVNPSVLRPLDSYRQDAEGVRAEKTTALVAVIAGAALVLGGVLLMPPSTPSAPVAVVPTLNGFAVVGAFP